MLMWGVGFDPYGLDGWLTIYSGSDAYFSLGHSWVEYKTSEGGLTTYGTHGNKSPKGLWVNSKKNTILRLNGKNYTYQEWRSIFNSKIFRNCFMKNFIFCGLVFLLITMITVLSFWYFKSFTGEVGVYPYPTPYENEEKCGVRFEANSLNSFFSPYISSYKEKIYKNGEKNIIVYTDLSFYNTSFVADKNFEYSKDDTHKITLGESRVLIKECVNEKS